MFCERCGQQARLEGAAYCGRCGQPFDVAPEPTRARAVADLGATHVAAGAPTATLTSATHRPAPAVATDSVARRAVPATLFLWIGFALGAILLLADNPLSNGYGYYGRELFRTIFGADARIVMLLSTACAFAGFVVSLSRLSVAASRRAWAIVLVAVAIVLQLLTVVVRGFGDVYDYGLSGVATGLVLAAWLLVRRRPGRAFLLVLPAVAVAAAIDTPPVQGWVSDVLQDPGPRLVFYWYLPVLVAGVCGLFARRFGTAAEAAAMPSAGRTAGPAGYHPANAYGYPPGHPAPQNTLAVVGFVLSFFVSIAGVVCGHIALSQIKTSGERGRGLAIAALVIGYLGLLLFVAYLIFIIALLKSV